MKLVILFVIMASTLAQKCHPECSWKCDDPRCDAVCTPVCEPPKCHSSCLEPKAAICDVKCERYLNKNNRRLIILDLTANQCALTKPARWWIAPNVLIFATHPTAWLIAKFQNQNAKLFALNQFAIGNALNPSVPSLNASLFAKTQLADLKFPKLF